MARVVWTIEVFAVPARGKDDAGADAAWTGLVGEFGSVARVAWRQAGAVARAAVADSFKCSGERAELGFPGYHAEALERKLS
jgi:hypothetical protein